MVHYDNSEIQAAYEEFVIRAHMLSEGGSVDIGSVLTDSVRDRNTAIAQAWGTENLPGGLSAANNPGFWEIAFSSCIERGYLQIDPNYLSKAERVDLFKDFENSLPAAIQKLIYFNHPEYLQKLSVEHRATLARIGGPRGYKILVDGGF